MDCILFPNVRVISVVAPSSGGSHYQDESKPCRKTSLPTIFTSRKFIYSRGRCSRVVKEPNRGWQVEFESSSTEDPRCRGVIHVRSVESSNALPWCGNKEKWCELTCRPRHLTVVQHYEVRRQKALV
ncbi:hypothetical protein TNCV_1621131 [Trichonephila clavipes]|nr:hypothetical protein TNCV_1621131 [Trichonephila clavipes]